MTKRADRFCVIGAGPCGLTAAKNLLQLSIPCDVIERSDEVGGNWYPANPHGSVYDSAHIISSKRMTEFCDFRMPKEYPHYPSRDQVWSYFRSYASEFGIRDRIQFNTSVESVVPEGDQWFVTHSNGQSLYDGVIVASGHHSRPRLPSWYGDFDGTIIHSHDYRQPQSLAGKRVLIVGGGNSGCDIAVEVARVAEVTRLSLRRGYHVLPKYLFGAPLDRCGDSIDKWWIPATVRRLITKWCLQVAVGPPQRYGMPKPDHELFQTHPIVNSQLLPAVGHGLLSIAPDVADVTGRTVEFVDGTREEFDVILCATGYLHNHPFLSAEWSPFQNLNQPSSETTTCDLHLNMLHPKSDSLFFVGLLQPDGGIWSLADYQSQFIARFVAGLRLPNPSPAVRRRIESIQMHRKQPPVAPRWRRRCLQSPRHVLEVDFFAYRRALRRELSRLPVMPHRPDASRSSVSLDAVTT